MTERAAVRRLYDRVGFGAAPGELDAAAAKGFDAAAATLLSTVDDPAAPAPPQLGEEPVLPKGKQKDKEARKQAVSQLRDQQQTLTLWWLDRMVTTGAPVVERLTWFWHGHFATSVQKVRSARLMLAQNQTLRRLALGDFAALTKAVVTDPAMLVWLDGQRNTAKAPNENLARELMELFTLGIGNYTEQDVKDAARALTGWKVDRTAVAASFLTRQHDGGDKTVLGRSGPLDASSLVDVLVAQQASPTFLAHRLWVRLVGNTAPDDRTTARLTAAYGPARDVHAMVRALVAEPAFRDQASTLVKQPVEWAAGLMRALKVRPTALPDADRAKLLTGLDRLGQVPFRPPSVGGWPSGGSWLTTSAALTRLQVARLVVAHADLSTAKDVDGAAALLGVDGWSARTRAALGGVARQPNELVAVAATAPEYVVSG